MGVAGGQGPGLPSPHAGAARVALTAVDRRCENESAQNRDARNLTPRRLRHLEHRQIPDRPKVAPEATARTMRGLPRKGEAVKGSSRSTAGKNETNTPGGISFSPRLPLSKKCRASSAG